MGDLHIYSKAKKERRMSNSGVIPSSQQFAGAKHKHDKDKEKDVSPVPVSRRWGHVSSEY
jgi:hypothetical protein